MERNLRKEKIGVVTSNKMEKSIVVSEKKSKTPSLWKVRKEIHKVYCS